MTARPSTSSAAKSPYNNITSLISLSLGIAVGVIACALCLIRRRKPLDSRNASHFSTHPTESTSAEGGLEMENRTPPLPKRATAGAARSHVRQQSDKIGSRDFGNQGFGEDESWADFSASDFNQPASSKAPKTVSMSNSRVVIAPPAVAAVPPVQRASASIPLKLPMQPVRVEKLPPLTPEQRNWLQLQFRVGDWTKSVTEGGLFESSTVRVGYKAQFSRGVGKVAVAFEALVADLSEFSSVVKHGTAFPIEEKGRPTPLIAIGQPSYQLLVIKFYELSEESPSLEISYRNTQTTDIIRISIVLPVTPVCFLSHEIHDANFDALGHEIAINTPPSRLTTQDPMNRMITGLAEMGLQSEHNKNIVGKIGIIGRGLLSPLTPNSAVCRVRVDLEYIDPKTFVFRVTSDATHVSKMVAKLVGYRLCME